MKRNQLAMLIGLSAIVLASQTAMAQFDLGWNTIDGGGEMFSTGSGGWELSGTIGQPDAGAMSGGSFELLGGFWAGLNPSRDCGDCLGDTNRNGHVDLSDLAALLANYGTQSGATCEDGDIDPPQGDGDVDLPDLAALLANFGTACE